MNPDVNGSDSQQRVEARGQALPPDHQTTILLLKPGKGPLSLKSRDHFLDRLAPIFLGLPDALRDLPPNTPLPELLAQHLRVIPFIRRDHFETFAGATSFACPHLDRIK